MAGLPEVALGQAGTGLAWMGPQSTFDPVQFARDSINVAGKKKATDEADISEYYKSIKPSEQYANDLQDFTLSSIEGINKYMSDVSKKQGWNLRTKTEAGNLINRFAGEQQMLKSQYEQGTKFKGIIDQDKGANLDNTKVQTNYSFWQAPDQFVGNEKFKKYEPEYQQIVQGLKQDPYFQANPELLKGSARVIFRQQHPELIQPILKPESLTKYIKSNEDVLFNTLTKDIEKGGVTIKEVSNDRDQRKVTFSNGSVKYVDGTDKTAMDAYTGDVDLKRSVDSLYEDLSENDKTKYANAENPALEWWKDYVNSAAGDITTSRRVEKTGNAYNFGGYSTSSSYKIDPFQKDQLTSRQGAIGGNTTTRGFNIRTPSGSQELVIKDINPPYYFLSDKSTQIPLSGGKNMSLEGATPFKAASFGANITFDQLKSKLEGIKHTDGENGWQKFLKKFGTKYKDAKEGGSLDGIILTNDEVQFLKDENLANLIKDRKFAYGTLTYYQEKEDGEGDEKRYQPGAVIPLEFVAGGLQAETGVDFNLALDSYLDTDYGLVREPVVPPAGETKGQFGKKWTPK